MPILVKYVRDSGLSNCVIGSPDIGGTVRARAMAEKLGVGLVVIDKTVSYTHLDVYKRQVVAGLQALLQRSLLTLSAVLKRALIFFPRPKQCMGDSVV